MSETPRISLCVAMYNVAQYLPRFVEGLAKQPNWAEMELIVVNDASTDDSEAVLRRELESHGLMAYTSILRHTENAGISLTRQDSLDAARGTYIIWADPDDSMDPGMYQDLANVAEREQADMVWSDYWDEGKTPPEYLHLGCEPDGETLFCRTAQGAGAYLLGKLFRRAFLQSHDIGFPREHLSLSEDVVFLLQVFHHRPKAYHLPKAYYHYYNNPNSAVHCSDADRITQQVKAYYYYERAAQTPKERRLVRQEMQIFKSDLVFWEDDRGGLRMSYDFVRGVFPGIRDLNDSECKKWIKRLLFGPSLRNRFLWHVCRGIYHAQRNVGRLFRAIRGKGEKKRIA